jgi:Hemolysin-coregulated protein (uncharacterized)
MAAVDYFLKIEGIEGESLDAKHKGELQIESWSWGATNSGSMGLGGGGGAGKVSMQDFHFVINFGKHSPKLMEGCATGRHFNSAVLTCRKAGGQQEEYLKIKFTDVVVSSYQTGGSANGSTLPMDQCSFNFTKIEMDYKEQKPDGTLGGSIKAGYDIKKNQKV